MAEADINSEAQSESMPVLKSERIYDFKDYTVVITGFACAAWCFITGGTLALYVGVQTALVASIAGNIHCSVAYVPCDAGNFWQVWRRCLYVCQRCAWRKGDKGISNLDVDFRHRLAYYSLHDGGESRRQYCAGIYRDRYHYRYPDVHCFSACRCGLLASCLEGPGAPEEAQHLRCAGFRHHPDLLVRGGVHELRLGHGSIRGASCAA